MCFSAFSHVYQTKQTKKSWQRWIKEFQPNWKVNRCLFLNFGFRKSGPTLFPPSTLSGSDFQPIAGDNPLTFLQDQLFIPEACVMFIQLSRNCSARCVCSDRQYLDFELKVSQSSRAGVNVGAQMWFADFFFFSYRNLWFFWYSPIHTWNDSLQGLFCSL